MARAAAIAAALAGPWLAPGWPLAGPWLAPGWPLAAARGATRGTSDYEQTTSRWNGRSIAAPALSKVRTCTTVGLPFNGATLTSPGGRAYARVRGGSKSTLGMRR